MQDIQLSPRQTEVLYLLANGRTIGQISVDLGIGHSTASIHIRRARERLGAVTKTEAVAIAITLKLVKLDIIKSI